MGGLTSPLNPHLGLRTSSFSFNTIIRSNNMGDCFSMGGTEVVYVRAAKPAYRAPMRPMPRPAQRQQRPVSRPMTKPLPPTYTHAMTPGSVDSSSSGSSGNVDMSSKPDPYFFVWSRQVEEIFGTN